MSAELVSLKPRPYAIFVQSQSSPRYYNGPLVRPSRSRSPAKTSHTKHIKRETASARCVGTVGLLSTERSRSAVCEIGVNRSLPAITTWQLSFPHLRWIHSRTTDRFDFLEQNSATCEV